MLLKALNSNSLGELKARLSLYVRQSPRQSSAILLSLVILLYGSMIPLTSLMDSSPTGDKDQKIYELYYEVPSDSNVATTTTTATPTPDFQLQFLDEVNPGAVLRPIGYATIDQTHRQNHYHTGVWIHLLDSTGRNMLLLKRGPQLVTCPNQWTLIGEHTLLDESSLETVQRGLVEEAWGGSNASYTTVVDFIRNMTAYPIYYFRDYGDRQDRQLTYLYEVKLNQLAKDVVFKFDDEVADHQWIDIVDFKQWVERDIAAGHVDFCHTTVTQLLLFGLERLAMLEGLTLDDS